MRKKRSSWNKINFRPPLPKYLWYPNHIPVHAFTNRVTKISLGVVLCLEMAFRPDIGAPKCPHVFTLFVVFDATFLNAAIPPSPEMNYYVPGKASDGSSLNAWAGGTPPCRRPTDDLWRSPLKGLARPGQLGRALGHAKAVGHGVFLCRRVARDPSPNPA